MNLHDRPHDPIVNEAARILADEFLNCVSSWGSFSEHTRIELRRIAARILETAAVTQSALENAALRYAQAMIAHRDATGRSVLEWLAEREDAEHDLLIAAGHRCIYCADGDCGITGTRPVEDTLPL